MHAPRWLSLIVLSCPLPILFVPTLLWAQATLENPSAGSSQSGIGTVSGWVCNANQVEIVFDDQVTLQAAYGTSRGDTQSVCGDTNNGFGLLVNWNLLGTGAHTVRALADGVEFGRATVTVTTFGAEFLTGGSTLLCRVPHVPVFGFDTYIRWQQSQQNFAIESVQPHDAQYQGPECGGELTEVTEDGTTSINDDALQEQLRLLPLEPLSTEESASLQWLREEEKLARDVYMLSATLYTLPIFNNIALSETTHTEAVLTLITRYQLTDPADGTAPGVFTNPTLQGLYDTFSARSRVGLIEALRVGAEIEELDIRDIETQKVHIDNRDILLVYDHLLSGSRNHLRAFVTVLAQQGQSYEPQYLSQEEYDAIIGSDLERGRR
ncbi:MAG: DUF2202 domain-containing protein [Candidatus Binatia bacterium]